MTRPIQINARKLLLAASLVLGVGFLLTAASPAQAKDEFEDGFKGELGRIAAHEAVFLGRGILGQVIHGGAAQVNHRRGGHGGRRGNHGGGRHDGDRGYQPHYKQNWDYQPYYKPSYKKHRRGYGHRRNFWHHKRHHNRHYQHRSRHHRHNRHCRH